MWEDALENLKPGDLRIMPGLATPLSGVGSAGHIMLSQDAPTNQQILDATRAFYGRTQRLVEATMENTNNVAASQKDYVERLNSHNWQNQQLTPSEQDQTSIGIFGETGGSGDGGIFRPTLDKVKASQLFPTIGVGVASELVGGTGGVGCAWDIQKRYPPRGYCYQGLEVCFSPLDKSLQVCVFNKLPSELTMDVFGLTVGVNHGLGATFAVFFTGVGTDPLGYSISIGVGLGGGAAVFGGHIWNFG